MPDGDLFEDVKQYLPKYLTPQNTSELFKGLAAFPAKQGPFYWLREAPDDELLQGDGWRGFLALNFQTAERKEVSGIIISNSCDIDPANRHDLPANVLFSPFIELSRYADLLRGVKTPQQLDDHLTVIRNQRITSIFHFPAESGVPEGIVMLDTVHTHPLQDFLARQRARLFTLHQVPFYMFVMKLSIHLMRFQENVPRFNRGASV
jgi:hypothetical protein